MACACMHERICEALVTYKISMCNCAFPGNILVNLSKFFYENFFPYLPFYVHLRVPVFGTGFLGRRPLVLTKTKIGQILQP